MLPPLYNGCLWGVDSGCALAKIVLRQQIGLYTLQLMANITKTINLVDALIKQITKTTTGHTVHN